MHTPSLQAGRLFNDNTLWDSGQVKDMIEWAMDVTTHAHARTHTHAYTCTHWVEQGRDRIGHGRSNTPIVLTLARLQVSCEEDGEEETRMHTQSVNGTVHTLASNRRSSNFYDSRMNKEQGGTASSGGLK